jgi:hypothetical protein
MGDVRYDVRRERIPQLEAQAAAARRLGERQREGNAPGICASRACNAATFRRYWSRSVSENSSN